MPATSTTEGQPKTILGEEAHGTQMTAPDTAGAGGPQFTESDNKDIHRDEGESFNTSFPSEVGANDSGLGLSPVRKKRKCVQFESVVTCLGSPNENGPETRDLKEDRSHLSDLVVPASVESDNSEGVRDVEGVKSVEDVGACIKKMTDETRHMLSKWKETFTESESFEHFCPSRMDELLKEALALEQNLLQQKAVLKNRLKGISQTLRLL